MTDLPDDVKNSILAFGAAQRAEGVTEGKNVSAATVEELQGQLLALRAQMAELSAKSHPVVGARVNDISWDQALKELGGNLKVTRLFYEHGLPATYSREGIPRGVKLIVSYKQKNTNVKTYMASIPTDEDVEVCYHHEPEADYANGGLFVAEFNAQFNLAKSANPRVPFVYIAGGYQWAKAGRNSYNGEYLPPHTDRNYMDSYQRDKLVPLAQDPSVQRYMQILSKSGRTFNGLTEYGRGVIPKGGTLKPEIMAERVNLFAQDRAYLRSLADVMVWCYWYTTDIKSGDQWRMTDAVSQKAWKDVCDSQ